LGVQRSAVRAVSHDVVALLQPSGSTDNPFGRPADISSGGSFRRPGNQECCMPARPTLRRGVGVLVVICLVAGLVTYVLVRNRTFHFEADGAPAVTVTLPALAGSPTFTPLPPADPDSAPLAMRLISNPVRIEAPVIAGTATVSLTYDPAALPPGTTTDDLMVVTYLDEYDLWLPAGADVDPVAHTVTAQTSHFLRLGRGRHRRASAARHASTGSTPGRLRRREDRPTDRRRPGSPEV